MKRAIISLFALLLFLAPAVQAQVVRGAPHQRVPDFLGWVPDEVIVVLTEEARRELVFTTDARGLARSSSASLDVRLQRNGVESFRRQFVNAKPQPAVSRFPDLTGHYSVKLRPGTNLDDAVRDLEADPDVDHVERIGMHALYSEPNDPYYRDSPNPSFPFDQWAFYGANGIGAEAAWDAEAGDQSVLVGALDSGVRYFHVDLGGDSPQWGPNNPFTGGNIFVNPGETPGNGQDDDGNGFVDDTIGYDFVSNAGGGGVQCIDGDCSGIDNNPDDYNGHGTHTAGTMGAITNNGVLVAGTAGGFGDGTPAGGGNGVKIVPMRIGYHARFQGFITGVVRMDWAAQAMNYMADLVDAGHNVAAANCSWGSSNSGGLNAAVDNLQAHDVLIVHAAGNSGSSSADFLGNKAGVLNVAATDENGNGAGFSNHGSWVDVAAPGVEILSLYRNPDDPDPTAQYIAVLDGTSMSAPHVAGIAALLESCTPTLSRTDKFNLIVNNTQPYNDSRDLGSGIANANLALAASGCSGMPCDITADFVANATSGCATLNVNFTDLSTGTGIDTWSWDFGDSSGSSAQNPSHAYTSAGTYTVSLTASSSTCGDTETKVGYITVGDVPIADFVGSPTSGFAPLTVNFSDLTSGGPTGWSWTFGDGGNSGAQNPSHEYTSPGTYTVSLTASNTCGSDGETKTAYITVDPPPPVSEMHVGDIVVVKVNDGQGFKHGEATVTILDDAGVPVAGATVTGDFTGKTTNLGVSGVTNGSGQVTLSSSSAKGGGEWCFEVTNVSDTLTYNPAENVVTQSCESGDVF